MTAPAAGAVIDPATYQKRTEIDNTPWRFNMEQNGKRMTADEFTAWMEARGVRVARGPAAHRPANPTKDGMAGQGSTMPVGVAPTATTTLVVAPATPATTDGLAPGSVEATDAWSDTAQAEAVTTSATILVPVPPPAEPATATPLEGDGAQ